MPHDPALRRLIDQVTTAREMRSALRIRGGGTKDFYGNAPRGEPLQMSALAGISSHEPTELVVTVRAGTPLAELEAALAEHGQCLPFEPPRFGARPASIDTVNGSATHAGTVGGMVAAGLAGPARASVGAVRDYVLGATMLNGDGEVLTFGGQVMKNVAGYDVSRLLAGSLGVLGAICEVSLKVLPIAPASATLAFDVDEAEALRRLNAWCGQPLPLNASAWHRGRLHVRLSGAVAAVRSAAARLGGEALAPEAASAWWAAVRDQTHAYFAGASEAAGRNLWRLAVPDTAAPLGLAGETFIEWHGAQRWWQSDAPAAEVRAIATRAGGHATLFRSAAEPKPAGAFMPLGEPLLGIHRRLKRSMDPVGLFNPGRLYPEL